MILTDPTEQNPYQKSPQMEQPAPYQTPSTMPQECGCAHGLLHLKNCFGVWDGLGNFSIKTIENDKKKLKESGEALTLYTTAI
jgi:hypothetical protein